MSFTDQKRRIATAADCKIAWGGRKDGAAFRCYLCGHKFAPGDGYRWVYTGGASFEIDGKRYGVTNLMTCDGCDGDDIIDRWVARNKDFKTAIRNEYWALI